MALVTAQHWGYYTVAMELIEAGARIDTRVVPIQVTFFAAVKLGKIEAVKRLIDEGADWQALDYRSHTPLQQAKVSDQAEVIQILRQHKSFYVPSRTASRRSEGSPATSPPAYPMVMREPFKPRPMAEE